MIEISCSIVLFNNEPEEVRNLVDSLCSYSQSLKVYLVDNSTEDKLRFQFISPQIEYIFTGKNIGYGAAHNLAIRKAVGKSLYHVVLNPDIEIDPLILNGLFEFMQLNNDVGLVMPKILYRTGELQYLCKKLPSPADLIVRRFFPGPLKFIFKRFLESYELRDKDYDSIMEVPNLSGCFMFVRTEVFARVGIFDEQYFMYLEDTDLCRRINECYRTVYYPSETIVHAYAKGSYKSLKLLLYHLRSSIQYFNKWGWFNDKQREIVNDAISGTRIRQRRTSRPFVISKQTQQLASSI